MADPKLDNGFIDVTDQIQSQESSLPDGFVDVTDNIVSSPARKKDETSLPGEFVKGAKAGWLNANQSVNQIIQFAGKELNLPTLEKIGKTGNDYWGKKVEEETATVNDIRNIESWHDFGKWASWNIGQTGSQIATIVPFMFMGGGEAQLAKGGFEVLGDLLKGNPGAAAQFGKFIGQWAKPKLMDIPVGILEGGQVLGGQLEAQEKGEIKELHPIRGLVSAFVATKLEELGDVMAVEKMIHGIGGQSGNLILRIAKGAAGTGAGEASEEFFQQYAEQFGIDPKDITSKEQFMQAVNGAAAGFVGGAAIGGVTGLPTKKELKEQKNQPTQQTPEMPALKETGKTTTEPVDIETFKQKLLSGNLTKEEALAHRKDILKAMPEAEDAINSIIVEADTNNLFKEAQNATEKGKESEGDISEHKGTGGGGETAETGGGNRSGQGGEGEEIKETPEDEARNKIVEGISSGKIKPEDYEFADNASPYEINQTYQELVFKSQQIEEANKPKIDNLKKQLSKYKGKRGDAAKAAKKKIEDRITALRGESQIIIDLAEIAYQNAQDKYQKKIAEQARVEGIQANEDKINEAIMELSDGRAHDFDGGKTWTRPLNRQVLDYLKENQEEPETNAEVLAPEITDQKMLEAMRPGTDKFEMGGLYRQKGQPQANSIIIKGIDKDGKIDGAYIHKGGLLSPAKFTKDELIPFAPDEKQISNVKSMFGIKTPAKEPLTTGEITPIQDAVKTFENTGTADIIVGKDYGITVKDEGEYTSVRFGPNDLTSTEDLKSGKVLSGEKNFRTPKEAFDYAKQLQDKFTSNQLEAPKERVIEETISTEPAKTAEEAKSRREKIRKRYGDTDHENGMGTPFRKDRIPYTNAREKEIATVLGYKEPTDRNGAGWEDYRPAVEEIELQPEKKGHASHHTMRLGKHPNGLFTHGGPLTIHGELFDSREEALKDAIAQKRRELAKDVTTESAKAYAKRLNKELDEIETKNNIKEATPKKKTETVLEEESKEIKQAGTRGKRGPKTTVTTPEIKEKTPHNELAGVGAGEKTIEAKKDIITEIASMSDEDIDNLIDTVADVKSTIENSKAATKGKQTLVDNAPPGGWTDADKVPDRSGKIRKEKQTAEDIISDAVKLGVKGMDEAVKGLYELFGGGSVKSFPGTFDEETYAKAKVHFDNSLQLFKESGKSLVDFVNFVIDRFGAAMKPYLSRFIKEQRAIANGETLAETPTKKQNEEPINLNENTGKGERGTRKKLTAQENADNAAKKKAAAEKKAHKATLVEFKNVGYVYDPEKLNAKIKNKTPKSALKIIIDEMTPGKVWDVQFPEGTTAGAVRFHDLIQKQFKSFKDYLISDSSRMRYARGKSMDARLDYWMAHQSGSVDILKQWAKEYGETLQPVIDAFKGQTSITNIVGKLQEVLVPDEKNTEGKYPDWIDRDTEKKQDVKRLVNNTDIVDYRRGLYNIVTDTWTQYLEAENDVLLSEINVHKRGRNKTIERVGLPEYEVNLTKTEDFRDQFGFKGVGFGEEGWINQEERNRVVPAAFNAFKDMAATIEAPDKGMSLGGELAVQFANLGHKSKGAAAAYFPDVQTMNFTRDNGDGCFAHERGHALHSLADNDARDEINSIIRTFRHIYDFDAGVRLVDDLLAKDSTFLKRMVSSKKQQRIDAIKEEVTRRFKTVVEKETDYYSTAKQMNGDYTAKNEEMWARAYEAYIYDTLKGKNNYLVSDFVASGRVGGKAGVGTLLVYPSGLERESFNETIKYFLNGLSWDEKGLPSLKEDYETIERHNEAKLQEKLKELLDTVEERYKAIWQSEPSADGLFWYQYDATSFGPMMQPDGYSAYDKEFHAEGQNGEGAIAYLTQLHPDVIIDYKLTNIKYEGNNATYIKEGGGINDTLREDGSETLEEESPGSNSKVGEGGELPTSNEGSSGEGEPGTRSAPKKRDTDGRGEGDSLEGIHSSTAGNYRITDETLTDPRSVGVRFSQNLAAIKVLKQVEEENRSATYAEKDILARYSGWGGMAELFSYNPSEAWVGKSELIKAELTDDEIRGAEQSSLSAYYTPVPVGTFMWKLAQRLGFERGIVLDGATGASGLFFGTMPADLQQSVALQGVEMDNLSARIASKLYELASIDNKPFQDVNKPNNRYDLTITNVPFESVVPYDKKHNKNGYDLHNYYINKKIDLTAPGGLSILITTSGTMDSSTSNHLKEYATKAEFVGAIRLPSGIYSATEVPTDILVFRKNIEGSKFKGIPVEDWTTTAKHESTGLEINKYFIDHPEMIAGKLEVVTGRFGSERLRVAPEGDLKANLERIAAAFPAKIVEREAVKELKNIDDIIAAPGTIKEGGLYINDKGQVCLKVEGEEEALPTGTATEKHRAEIAKSFVKILDQIRTVLRSQKQKEGADIVKGHQVNLKKEYNAFVKKHGAINLPKNAEIYNDITDSDWVLALEEYDPDEKKVIKLADIFTKDITNFGEKPTRAETDHDALSMSLDEFGYPNLDYMAKLRDSDVESVMKGVSDKVIEDPETGFLVTMDEYLSGNVKRKLNVARDMAESNPEYQRNVTLLEANLPTEIPAHRITARIGASWIHPDHLSAYVKDKLNLDERELSAVFNFNPASCEWSLSFKGRSGRWGKPEVKAQTERAVSRARQSVEARRVWGTDRVDFLKLMEYAIEGRRPEVTYRIDGKTYIDVVATKAAEVKLQEIQADFGTWIFKDTERGDEAVKRFNDLINTSIPMKGDGSHLTLPGKSMAMITPTEAKALGVKDAVVFYPHQLNATWKYARNGNIYLAHEVGAGKTATMVITAMEAKRLKGKKKVLYVTLNDSTFDHAISEFKKLYPLCNVLPVRVSTQEQRKRRALQKIALNDFDVAIMRQQDLDRIALSPEAERTFIDEELLELREILEEAKKNGARILERDIQERIKQLEEKLKAPGVHEEAKSKNIFFDDLGIDLIIVDEAHSYKNIPYATRLQGITGLNPAGSPTAKAFFRKTQWLNAQYPKNDSVVLASGTALTNSIAELYNIQRMLQPKEVKRLGVWSFDRWLANYGDIGSEQEWDGARGRYKTVTINRRIVNAGRLLATVYQNIDSVRAKDTPIRRPEIRGGEPKRIKIKPNQYVEDYKQIIYDRCAELERDPKNAEYEGIPDNMLRIISNMSAVAIDQRLLSGKENTGKVDKNGKSIFKNIPGPYSNTELQQDSKIYEASNIIYKRWQEEAEHKGVQLVFADIGIPKRYDTFKYKTPEQLEKLSEEALDQYEEERTEHENSVAGFNTYDGLKTELIKKGIPAAQIAFIHDADDVNKDKKAENLRKLFKKVNAGDIRVLIGSTSKAGTGVNIQKRVSDIHHMDVWWNFSAWEQRNGRGIRSGNNYVDWGGINIWNYVTETTVDATRWDKVFAKGKVLNAVLGGDINLDILDDISEETMSAKMMAAEASGNPLMAKQATLLQQVQSLRFEQSAFLDNVRQARIELAAIPEGITAAEKRIDDYKRSRNVADKITAVRFVGDNRTLVLEKHGKEIAEALEKAVLDDPTSWSPSKKAPLLVFGSHTENSFTDKDGKKQKQFAFSALPVKADITAVERDPFGRNLLISGDILSAERTLAGIQLSAKGKAENVTADVKANISRTVTEYLSWLDKAEESANEFISDSQKKEPKLKDIIDKPWVKENEFVEKSKELVEVNAELERQGEVVGNPETGIEISKYAAAIPVMEDVTERESWRERSGYIYPNNYENPEMAIKPRGDLKDFSSDSRKAFKIKDAYSTPDNFALFRYPLDPDLPEIKPVAYTTIDGNTRFWLGPADRGLTIDPVQWNLLKRIIGNEDNWHLATWNNRSYLVHYGAESIDAFKEVRRESKIPSGVKAILEKDHAQLSVREQGVYRLPGLAEVKDIFKGQQVTQLSSGQIWIKTIGGRHLTIMQVDHISADEMTMKIGYSRSLKPTEKIAGAYLKVGNEGQIRLVRGQADKWTLAHESVHFMEDIGVINDQEVKILKRHINNLVNDGKFQTLNKDDIGGAEDRAEFLARALQREPVGMLGRIINKIQDFIDKLVNLFSRTVRGITRDIKTGAIYGKETNEQREARLDLEGGRYAISKSLQDLEKMNTDDLEKYIDDRYEAGAPQEEIDYLEDIFSKRVSEEDLNVTEEDTNMGEGISVEEQLADMYNRYINPNYRGGMDEKGIISNMRTAIQNAGGGINLTDKNILAAARDAYEYKKLILDRYKESLKQNAQYSIRQQTDPPVSSDPKVLNFYLKDETDAIVQTIFNKLRPKNMTWLETMLKSPEWFDHPQIGNIVKLFMRDRNEIYHETFNDLNMTDDVDAPESTVTEAAKALKHKGLSLTERLAGKVSPEYKRLQDIIDEGDTAWKRNLKEPLEKQVAEFEAHIRKQPGTTDDVIRVWKLYRQSFDKALDLQTRQLRNMIAEIIEEAHFKGETPDISELKQSLKGALAQMEEWRGFYAPRLREMGNWKVQAYKEHGPLKESREWYREHRNSELAAQRLAKKLEREGWKIYNVSEVERIPETIYQDVNAVATAKLIDSALEKLSKKSELRDNLTAQFNEEILREVSNAIKARGFRSTMIHRGRGNVIRGFVEDPIQRHLQYINNLSGGISKARVARMAMQELIGEKFNGEQIGGIDPVKDSKAFAVAQDYIQEQLRNADSSDRIIGLAKSIATFKFLGFNLRSLAVNMTAVMTTAPAAIHQYAMGGNGSIARVMNELAKAGKDYGTVMAGRKLHNADEQAFIDEEHRKGWDDAQYTREALGELSKTHSRIWSTMMDGSMYLFGQSEKWNRGTTMLAAYRLARKKGMGHVEAAEAAKTASDRAHGVYGKSTMPMWAQGTNPAAKIGQMAYVYSKFGHNYLQMLYDLGVKRHNIKAAMFAFLSPLVIAGATALPFKDVIFAFAGVILRSLFGEDKDPEKWVWDIIREHLGADAEKIGRHGLVGETGLDISSSLSIGVGIPKNFIDLTGAIGGVATDISEFVENLGRGQYAKASEKILPAGASNVVRAFRESQEGVTTKNNRRVWNEQGRPFVPDTGASVARGFGFRSTDQAVLSERTWEGHREQAKMAEERKDIYERYRAWMLSGRKDNDEYKSIIKDAKAYNNSVKGMAGVPRITSDSLRNQRRQIARPSKNERAILRN